MTLNGRAYRQRLWVPAISETAGGALPTPVAQTGAGGPKGLDGGSGARQMLTDAGFPRAAGAPSSLPTPRTCSAMAAQVNSRGNLYGDRFTNLETVIGRMLPTPSACLANDGERTETWLARRERVKLAAKNGNGMGMPLAIAAQLLTPCASDWKGRTNWEAAERHGPQRLPDCLPTGAATYLNPSFVEEMMGYPVGWTA